jgi:hypothetical protein
MENSMNWLKSLGLWILALLITIGSAIYQRKTGPTYPIENNIEFAGTEIDYKLLRSHGGEGDMPVELVISDTTITSKLYFRRYKSLDDWTSRPMMRDDSLVHSSIPHQPPAGKVEYYIELKNDDISITIPQSETAITRFKGDVPAAVLIPHILFIFTAMLVSTRTGLEALFSHENLTLYTAWTLVFLFIGGMIMGPLVQKYAFDAYWTGFPFGTDLTDNKTLIALIAWIIAYFMLRKRPKAKGWALFAAITTLVIFMIPHSMMGSELDYTKLETQTQSMQQSAN